MRRKLKLLTGVLLLAFTLVYAVHGQHTAYADTYNTISGTLTDRSGNPIANAGFDIMSATTARIPVRTNASGSYSVNVLPGKYGIYPDTQVNYGGSAFYLYNTITSGAQYFIDATSGNVTQDLQYDNVSLNVNFVDHNNNPISGAAVSVKDVYKTGTTTFAVGRPDVTFTAAGGGSLNDTLFTNAGGLTMATTLRGIKYNVCAVSPTTAISTCTTFTPTADTSTVTLVAPQPLSTISGTLTDRSGNPIANATFDLRSVAGQDVVVHTSSTGAYSANVTPGKFGVFPNTQVNYGGSAFYLYNTITSGEQYFIDATGGNVTQNFQYDNVSLNVIFVDQNNNPIPNAAVSVKDVYKTGTTTFAVGHPEITFTAAGGGAFNDSLFTNAGGTTSATALRGIEYNVCAVDPASNTSICTTFAPTADISTVTLTAPTHYTISGTLTDRSGNPISGARFDILSVATVRKSVTTDSNGHYSVNVVPEKYGVFPDTQVNYGGSAFYLYNTITSGEQYFIDATGGNVTQNLQYDNVALNINFVDENGNPIPNAAVSAKDVYKTGTTTFAVGRPDITYTAAGGGTLNNSLHTGVDGSATATVLRGIEYNVCAVDPVSNVSHCVLFTPTIEGTNSITISEATRPNPPTDLNAQSPTNQAPALTWDAAIGATSYNVYRDGIDIGSTATAVYADTTAGEGAHSYYVTAINTAGESGPSNSVTVLVDKTNPAITYTLSPALNTNGWNNGDVIITFNCSDSASGVQTCSQPVTLSTEGANQSVTGTATDNAGNTSTVAASINLDKTEPVLVIPPTWTNNPLQQGQNTTLSIPASDSLSGLANVQYSLDGGTPQPMTYDIVSGTWRVTFGSTLTVNTYNLTITATDKAGNTATASDILAVYNAANGYVTGHAKTLPTTSDTLPIALDTFKNPTNLVLGFTNVMAPASGSFDLEYKVKNGQNEFNLASTGISWVVVQDSTHASILGHADMVTYVNGVMTVTSNMTVRFDIVLGTNGASDHITVKIFNRGDDPNTATPAYVISDDITANGSNLMIHP